MKALIQTITLSAVLMTLVGSANAGDFKKRHPRRAEVNQRIRNQEKAVTAGVKTGELTPEEAKAQRQNLREIKKEERSEVVANGGHLTKDQTKNLNQKLNETGKEIQEEKKN